MLFGKEIIMMVKMIVNDKVEEWFIMKVWKICIRLKFWKL